MDIKIEYHDGNKDIAIETNMKQTVYIYKCVNSTIKVTGKGSFHIFPSARIHEPKPIGPGPSLEFKF